MRLNSTYWYEELAELLKIVADSVVDVLAVVDPTAGENEIICELEYADTPE